MEETALRLLPTLAGVSAVRAMLGPRRISSGHDEKDAARPGTAGSGGVELLRTFNPNNLTGRTVLISYPKSGRTWLRYIFHMLGLDVELTHAGYGTGGAKNIGKPFQHLKKRVMGRRNIFLHRNPLDTCVSLYFQVHRTDLISGAYEYQRKYRKLARAARLPPQDMDEFALHPVWGVENVCKFNAAWLAYLADRPCSMVLSYEHLREDPEARLTTLLEFIGAEPCDLAAVIDGSRFEKMRLKEIAGTDQELRLNGPQLADVDALKVRRGKVQGYTDYLSTGAIAEASRIAAAYGFEV